MTSIYKFSGLAVNKLACLASNTLWFSTLDDFNDPFEGQVLITSLDNSAKSINTALKNIFFLLGKDQVMPAQDFDFKESYSLEEKFYIIDFIRDIFESELRDIKKMAACSFMEAGDEVINNQHMWSHYADGLRGYCLRFNKEELTSSLIENDGNYLASTNIKYSDARPSIDAVNYFCSFDTRCNNAFIGASLAPRLKIYSALSTKSMSWNNEKELRLLSGKSGSLKYSGKVIEEIIIGEKMPIDQQFLVIGVIRSVSPNVTIKKAVMGKDSYSLTIVPYES